MMYLTHACEEFSFSILQERVFKITGFSLKELVEERSRSFERFNFEKGTWIDS